LATLAAYLRPDDEAVIVDEHVEPLRIDDLPDLVLIQVYITNAYRAYRIADHYRAQGIFVGLGGLHVTSLADEAARHADAIFLGPGEQTFPQFLQDFRAGQPQRVYASTPGALWTGFHLYAAISYAAVAAWFQIPLWSRAAVPSTATSATKTHSFRAADPSIRREWMMLWRRLRACPDATFIFWMTTFWVTAAFRRRFLLA